MAGVKPHTEKRAEALAKYYKTITLCADSCCVRSGAYLVDGIVYCGQHAGRAALDALMEEDRP